MKESNMNYEEVINLPYAIYLGLYRQFYIINLESSEEGREALMAGKRMYSTEADVSKIRGTKFYNN